MLDFDKLTLGEIAKIEDLSGLPLSSVADEEKPKGKAMAALAFVAVRRDPDRDNLTFAQCLDLTQDEAFDIIGLNDDEEDEEAPKAPTPTKAKPKTKKP